MRTLLKSFEPTKASSLHRCSIATPTLEIMKATADSSIRWCRAWRLRVLVSLCPKAAARELKEAFPLTTALNRLRTKPCAENFRLWRMISPDFLASGSSFLNSDFERAASLDPNWVSNIPSLPARSVCQRKSAAFLDLPL